MNATKTPSRTHTIINWTITILLAIFIIIALCWGIYTYYRLDHDLYTNDAQVEEYITPVNTRITGYIKEVRFNDHQRVRKGDTLVVAKLDRLARSIPDLVRIIGTLEEKQATLRLRPRMV